MYTPATYVQENALVKAREVWEKLAAEAAAQGTRPADMVIGSDTVVSVDDRILEKPPDAEAAMAMLSSLSGRRHRVYSGVAILHVSIPQGRSALCDLWVYVWQIGD